MADNFDLKKFLKESKALENLNPIVAKENLSEGDVRSKIKEYILAELGTGEDYELETRKSKYNINPELEDEDYSDYFFDIDTPEDELDEAKKKDKKEDVKDVEIIDTETEDTLTDEIPAETTPTETTPDIEGGLADLAANMKGTENDLMKNLMDALQIAKGMGNEKLETQIGNTLKFFVSEYIGGSEQ
jgi:hypothetical protein